MTDFTTLYQELAKEGAANGAHFRTLSYQGTAMSVNPRIKHKSLNSAYIQTRNVTDALESWEAHLSKAQLTADGIPNTALQAGEDWVITEADSTQVQVFINLPPQNMIGRYKVMFSRAVTGANLTVNYEVGQGTFTTDPATGNPVEDTVTETFYATVTQQRNRTQFERAPGLAPARIYLEGYFITSTGARATQPTNLQVQIQWPCVLSDPNTGIDVEGFFRTLVRDQDPWSEETDKRGSKIAGWFSSAGSGR